MASLNKPPINKYICTCTHAKCSLHCGISEKNLNAFLISSLEAAYPAHFTFPDWTTLVIFGEKYKL